MSTCTLNGPARFRGRSPTGLQPVLLHVLSGSWAPDGWLGRVHHACPALGRLRVPEASPSGQQTI